LNLDERLPDLGMRAHPEGRSVMPALFVKLRRTPTEQNRRNRATGPSSSRPDLGNHN
jgi:hypothetical protein